MSRLREWNAVMREELGVITWREKLVVIAKITLAVISARRVKRLDVLNRYKVCVRCPLFDRQLKRCRPFTGSRLGCGCYAPYKVIVSDHGWAFLELSPETRQEYSIRCW